VHVRDVLEVGAAAERDLIDRASVRSEHRQGGAGCQPAVAPGAVDHVRSQATLASPGSRQYMREVPSFACLGTP
jgi:hypothetical protein